MVSIHSNITYSYAIIVAAAEDVQKENKWADDRAVHDLKFTPVWVRSFLSRADMTRRKITTEDKRRPSDLEVMQHMKVGQDIYTEKKLALRLVWNMDETAITWAIGPTHMFVSKQKSERAKHAGVSNVKLRITAAITVNDEGFFSPLFFIIKHSAKVTSQMKPDQTALGKGSNNRRRNSYSQVLLFKTSCKRSCYYISA